MGYLKPFYAETMALMYGIYEIILKNNVGSYKRKIQFTLKLPHYTQINPKGNIKNYW